MSIGDTTWNPYGSFEAEMQTGVDRPRSCGDDPRIRLPVVASRPDHDLDVTPQRVQEPEEPVGGEPVELPPEEGRHLGLVDSQELRRPGLRELSGMVQERGFSGNT